MYYQEFINYVYYELLVLLSASGDFWATYQPKMPYGIYGGEWVDEAVLLISKLKTTIDLDRCAYISVVLHQRLIKAFKGICGMF